MKSCAQALRKRGFTLMETVLVVAVGISLIIGGVLVHRHARFNSKVLEMSTTLLLLSREIQSRYKDPQVLWNMDDADMSAMMLSTSDLPPERLQSMNIFVDGHFIAINVGGLDPKVCRRIMGGDVNVGNSRAFVDLPVIGSKIVYTNCYSSPDETDNWLHVGYALATFSPATHAW